jgi:hypothetical protein
MKPAMPMTHPAARARAVSVGTIDDADLAADFE